jgi:predicted DCC family thiol-disulfide oxidoreductase YuxK
MLKQVFDMNKIILFDGVCNVCNKSVQFVIKRDNKNIFKFASLQSNFGQKMIKKYRIHPNMNSLVLIDEDTCYFESTAALKICKQLNGFWKFMYIFIIVPAPIRNFVYRIIAKNRYKWFGHTQSCPVYPPDVRKKFIHE